MFIAIQTKQATCPGRATNHLTAKPTGKGGLERRTRQTGVVMYSTSIHQKPPSKTPIYAWGKRNPVGFVVGDEFRKSIKESGYLREPPAICIDAKSLTNAEKAGARWVVITDKDDGRIHRAAIAKIMRDGFEIDREFRITAWIATVRMGHY